MRVEAEQDEQVVQQKSGKALERGTRRLSKQSLAVLAKYQARLNAAVHGRRTNAPPVYLAAIIGAAKFEENVVFLANMAAAGKDVNLKWLRVDQDKPNTCY